MKQKDLVPLEIKIPLRPRRRSTAATPGTSNPTILALPASHHHLDVLPLLLFLLRGGIRLGRHDGTLRQNKAWYWDDLPHCRVPAWRGTPTQAARSPRSPLGAPTGRVFRPAPAEPSNHQPRLHRTPRNGTTSRRLNLKKEPCSLTNCSAGTQGTMGRGVFPEPRPWGVARGKVKSGVVVLR